VGPKVRTTENEKKQLTTTKRIEKKGGIIEGIPRVMAERKKLKQKEITPIQA